MNRRRRQTNETEQNTAEETKKGKQPKVLAATGVVIAVLAALGATGFVWHEQPSFCSAVCHTPMDAYVEGFLSDDITLLADDHASTDLACLDCHVPTMAQQIEEAQTWISKDFVFYEETGLLYPRKTGTAQYCTQPGCHSNNEELIVATESYEEFNPHGPSHNGKLECFTCHNMHRQSVFYCATCHEELIVPEGWTTDTE